jgi:ABC-2 type transport system permease protein
LLECPWGLAIRLTRPTVVAWGAALAVTALIFGLIAKPAGAALSGSNSVNRVLSRLGAHGAGADSYLGIAFLIMAIMLGFVAVSLVTAAREEEADGRLDHLLVRPLSRWSWLGGRVFSAGAIVVMGALEVGAFTWLGAASGHAGLPVGRLVDAGLNIAPPALLVLGFGVLVIGVWPRATSIAVYGLIVWSVLVAVVGGFSANNHWLLDTSLFHQMAPAPASAPDWTTGGVMIALAAAAAVVGEAAFWRRDVVGA